MSYESELQNFKEYFEEFIKKLREKGMDLLKDHNDSSINQFIQELFKPVDFDRITARIERLFTLSFELPHDFGAKRDAQSFLGHLWDQPYFFILADDLETFKQYLDSSTNKEKHSVSFSLYASLVNAEKISEYLFNSSEHCNPKINKSIIPNAISSGNIEWVEELVTSYEIDITEREYSFQTYASLMNSQKAKDFFKEVSARKSSSIALNKEGMFSNQNNSSKSFQSKIRGELLESLTEIILGELETLADTDNDSDRNLLVDILLDSEREVSEVVSYANEIDTTLKNRFAILYCLINPKKWDDPWMQESGYHKAMFKSYIDRAYNDTELPLDILKQETLHLKEYANDLAIRYIARTKIRARALSEKEISSKNEILRKIEEQDFNHNLIVENSLTFEAVNNELKRLYDEEGCLDVVKNFNALAVRDISQINSELSMWKTINKHENWPKIYTLVKQSPGGRIIRDEIKMCAIIQAILYKLENKCRWQDLPQHLPSQTMVRHYYYEFRKEDKLKQLHNLVYHQQNRNYDTIHSPMMTTQVC